MGRSSPNRQPLVVDWFYIRYRTILAIVAIVLVGAGGVLFWLSGTRRAPAGEADAARAISAAEQVIDEAAALAPGQQSLAPARREVARALELLDRREFAGSVEAANAAERLGRDLLAGMRAAEAGVRIVRVDGDVRVRRAGQFVWAAATEHDQLKVGDQVRTGGNGSAQLVYFDGTMMTVSPETLLEIRELHRDQAARTQRVSGRLEFGELSAQTQEAEGYASVHEVSTESAAVRANSASEFQVRQAKDGGRSEVVANRGRVVVEAAGREVPVGESRRVTLEGARIVDEGALLDAPQLVAPPDQRNMTVVGPVTLSWSAVPGARGYFVHYSDRPIFTIGSSHARQVTTPAFAVQQPALGTHYWRVAAIDDGGRPGQWSETRRFRVLSEEFRDADDRTPPTLEISELMVVGTNAIVTGRAEPGVLVWIDGERVDLEDDGRFTWVVKLREDGINKIRFVAQDAAGNETRKIGTARLDVF